MVQVRSQSHPLVRVVLVASSVLEIIKGLQGLIQAFDSAPVRQPILPSWLPALSDILVGFLHLPASSAALAGVLYASIAIIWLTFARQGELTWGAAVTICFAPSALFLAWGLTFHRNSWWLILIFIIANAWWPIPWLTLAADWKKEGCAVLIATVLVFPTNALLMISGGIPAIAAWVTASVLLVPHLLLSILAASD